MSDLKVPIAYDNWATEALIAHCLAIPAEQLELTTPGTMGTVKATLIHLVGAKERYAAALTGRPLPDDAVRESTTTDLAHVRGRAEKLSAAFEAFAAGVLDLDSTVTRRAADGATQQMPLWVLLAQFLHHGNEHRAQLGSIFGAHGLELPQYSAFHWAQTLGKLGPL